MSVDPAAEEQFGPYAVYERLGIGGMAMVHRALEHLPDGTERTVALKRLLPHLAEDASFIKSFVREAKLASILDHINVVHIYELGRVGTEYFISMEYIDGRDLRRLLRHARKVTGPPPINVTVGLMIQLCDALDYAHNKLDADGQPLRLVHRDISPSNLIVTREGHLKVIDFGIAKAESSQLRTQTGRIKGKLAYMPPEAVSGNRDLDARSDIWACGVILHELLTARPLFASKNEYQTLLKVQKGDILPAATFNQACPPELDAIVFKALAREPADRFANAAEMREQLVAIKRQYALQSGYGDVATWIDWAFGLEAPGGFSGDTSGVLSMDTSRVDHGRTPRPPRNSEEEAAAEVVWGSGDNESEDGPIVLEEVPDVSEKYVRPRRDTADESLEPDDIPTPLPSHGTMPSIYGGSSANEAAAMIPPIQRPAASRHPGGATPTAGAQRIAKPTTGAQPIVPMPAKTPSTGVQPVAPMPGKTPVSQQAARANRPTNPGMAPATPAPQGRRPGDLTPATAPRASDRMPASPPSHVDAPQLGDRMAAQRARESIAPDTQPATPRAPSPDLSGDTIAATSFGSDAFSDDTSTHSFARDAGGTERDGDNTERPSASLLSEEELFGNDAAAVLRGVSEQMEAHLDAATTHAMQRLAGGVGDVEPRPSTAAATLPSVPVVRFSKSIPPPNVSSTPRDASSTVPPINISRASPSSPPVNVRTSPSSPPVNVRTSPSSPPGLASSALDPLRPVATKPGVGPSVAATPPRTNAPSGRPKNQTLAPVGPAIVAPNKHTWIWVVGGLLLAAGAAAAVAIALAGGSDEPARRSDDTTVPPPPPTANVEAPIKPTGTVKFMLKPDDAEIKVEGAVVHTGSPWTSELPAGIHRIEIHKPGYKAWLTSLELSAGETHSMTVVLEPITTATPQEDATLTIVTTPAGLDVEIDGQPFAGKTPIKTTLAVGPHKISVKQNGAEVWQQNINAEAASDYEFNPSFTDAKRRERAQRATSRPAPAPAPTTAPTSTRPAAPAPTPTRPIPPAPTPARPAPPATAGSAAGGADGAAAAGAGSAAQTTSDEPAAPAPTPAAPSTRPDENPAGPITTPR